MVNVRRFLDDHEQTLLERLVELRSEIVPLEQELLEVRLAKAALRREAPGAEQHRLALASPGTLKVHDAVSSSSVSHIEMGHDAIRSPYSRLTIKELVRKALAEHFEHGATANELIDLFENVWGRAEIARTSLSPQLSRLKNEGVVFRNGHIWRLRIPRPNEKAATDQ